MKCRLLPAISQQKRVSAALLLTTALAPIWQPSAIVIFPNSLAPGPIQTRSPIVEVLMEFSSPHFGLC